ncbi:hypothetical protein KXD93_08310 [Mucilaginibacter sp. BJC16-A38]|uniref:hypothetical protein n=1 Tax=Mucilaginibacter phenanthrenivorans TaxID=1234842 RepID=UPI002157B6A5|nr:hypothetical protein [Mucilaginibacter phenanthrenivorans]MCR8557642.1 hypothetical protein [Mucilaginibacter phenanthrenivorans]
MANPFEYIVYEPDQVLTNEHLNETFNYLDQQNRWTRNKLIGIGIVCGLDIVLNPGVIEVTKGCGITSQGYLIAQEATNYTYYIPYSPVEIPGDLPFDHGAKLPFYAPFWATKKIWQLITDDQYAALESAKQLTAVTISSATSFLQDYVVALFLEAKETDLKNCNMQDCNNSGATMAFAIRPLLVAIKDLPEVLADSTNNKPTAPAANIPHQISLKRFNVPYAALNSTADVLNAFANIVDDTTLTQVSNAYNFAFQKYGGLVNVATNPFANLLANLKSYRNTVLTQNQVFIQYFYDFVDDLIKAWYEFSVKVSDINDTCCPDENLFPLHLILGLASDDTDPFTKDAYRDYFMYSGLFSQNEDAVSGAMLLFNRMVIMANKFTVQSQALQLQATLKITPSQYEYPWLSERAIPYYYQVNAAGAELYKYWNYHKTSHGSAAFNLGYNANLYNSNTAVTQPLLYDIEYNNFFRIEGFIGQNYNNVLTNILNQRQQYNLPFDVVAVSADQLKAGATLPQCNINDLETDYKLIIGEAACKIHLVFCFISKLPYKVVAYNSRKKTDTGLFETDKPVALKFSAFKVNVEAIDASGTAATAAYKKGDFMRQYCPAVADTIGSAYLNSLSSTGVFTNPVQINQSVPTTTAYHYFFEFIDSVETMMYALQTNTLAQLDIAAFNTIAQTYLVDTVLTFTILTELTVALTPASTGGANAQFVTLVEDTELDLLVDEMGVLTTICIAERIAILKTEYTARLTKYQQQLNFLNYYKNHPGLEHKAGVPKGGTFVLVYHSAATNATTPPAAAGSLAFEVPDEVVARENVAAAQAAAPAAPAATGEDTIKLIRSYLNSKTETLAETKDRILVLLERERAQAQQSQAQTIPDGAVIADFYIPYLCCSDCPPVAYVLEQPKNPPPPKPVVSMNTTFCDNDTDAEKITVSIAGGTFKKVAGLDDKGLTFTPATAGAGTYTIAYTAGGIDADPVTVTVLPTPNRFDFSGKSEKVTPNTDRTFTIDAAFGVEKPNTKFTYKWTFGDGFTVKEATGPVQHMQIIFDPEKDKQIKTQVTLTTSNGNCANLPVAHSYIVNPNGIQLAPTFKESETGFIKGIEGLFTKKKKK